MKPNKSESVFGELMKALRADPQFGPKLAEIDEIEKEVAEAVEHVMLDVAFSPVLISPTTTTDDAVEVAYQGGDGRYVIKEPALMMVKAEELRVMRARYLIVNGREQQPKIDRFLSRNVQP